MAAETQREFISRNTKAKPAAMKADGLPGRGRRTGEKPGHSAGSKRICPTVIEKLADIRKYEKAGISQEAIAKLIGVSRSTLIRNLKSIEEEGLPEG